MVKVKALQVFEDLYTGTVYKPGDVLEITKARYDEFKKNLSIYGGEFLELVEEETAPVEAVETETKEEVKEAPVEAAETETKEEVKEAPAEEEIRKFWFRYLGVTANEKYQSLQVDTEVSTRIAIRLFHNINDYLLSDLYVIIKNKSYVISRIYHNHVKNETELSLVEVIRNDH